MSASLSLRLSDATIPFIEAGGPAQGDELKERPLEDTFLVTWTGTEPATCAPVVTLLELLQVRQCDFSNININI